jgi:hypothetical protein
MGNADGGPGEKKARAESGREALWFFLALAALRLRFSAPRIPPACRR